MTNTVPYRVGEWLPSDHAMLTAWLEKCAARAHASDAELAPVLVEFQELIESRPEIYMLFNGMFTEVPKKPPYNRDPAGEPTVRSYQQMISMLNVVLRTTPEFNETGVVGFPINAILDWAMGTEAGFAAFLHPEVNAMLKKVLSAFGDFLTSSASAAALNEDPERGWLGDSAMQAMAGALPAVPGSGELDYWDRQLTPDQAKQIFGQADLRRDVRLRADPGALGLRLVGRVLHADLPRGPAAGRRAGGRPRRGECLRVGSLRPQARSQGDELLLD